MDVCCHSPRSKTGKGTMDWVPSIDPSVTCDFRASTGLFWMKLGRMIDFDTGVLPFEYKPDQSITASTTGQQGPKLHVKYHGHCWVKSDESLRNDLFLHRYWISATWTWLACHGATNMPESPKTSGSNVWGGCSFILRYGFYEMKLIDPKQHHHTHAQYLRHCWVKSERFSLSPSCCRLVLCFTLLNDECSVVLSFCATIGDKAIFPHKHFNSHPFIQTTHYDVMMWVKTAHGPCLCDS